VNLYTMTQSKKSSFPSQFKRPRFNCIYDGRSFQSTAIQSYLDHIDDRHNGIEPPICARPTDTDIQASTSTGILPWFSGATLNLDSHSHENTTLTSAEPIEATMKAEDGANLVHGEEESEMVDSDFASSDSKSDTSITSGDDLIDNCLEMQGNPEMAKRDSFGQWDEIFRIESYPSVRAAGAPTNLSYLESLSYPQERSDKWNPWEPFANAKDYDLAKWFVEAGTTMVDIDSFFNRGLCGLPGSFSSSRDLKKLIHTMESKQKTPEWHQGTAKDVHGAPLEFYYRKALECVKNLLSRVHLSEAFVWAPERHYNARNERLYSEMHTADWWWNMQVK